MFRVNRYRPRNSSFLELDPGCAERYLCWLLKDFSQLSDDTVSATCLVVASFCKAVEKKDATELLECVSRAVGKTGATKCVLPDLSRYNRQVLCYDELVWVADFGSMTPKAIRFSNELRNLLPRSWNFRISLGKHCYSAVVCAALRSDSEISFDPDVYAISKIKRGPKVSRTRIVPSPIG